VSENGTIAPPDFTHPMTPFVVEGHTFRRKKVKARAWADKLKEIGVNEQAEIKKKHDGVLFAVSEEGLYELVALGIHDDDLGTWEQLREDGLLEFGELAALKDWLWGQITERPFSSDGHSSSGPGTDSEASSKDGSPSTAEVLTG